MPNDGFLHRYFLTNAHKRLYKWIHYLDIYEHHFHRYRGRAPVMLEIGVAGDGSLAMWKEYFGKGSRIIGLDTNPDCMAHQADGIDIFIGNQADPAILAEILARFPLIDIVLDDGSHTMSDMRASFEFLYPKISPFGVYFVEDLHTCYWEEYGGGLKAPGTFIELAKDLMDVLNATHSRGTVPVTEVTASTFSISTYDSIIAFEKRPQVKRLAPITEKMKIA